MFSMRQFVRCLRCAMQDARERDARYDAMMKMRAHMIFCCCHVYDAR